MIDKALISQLEHVIDFRSRDMALTMHEWLYIDTLAGVPSSRFRKDRYS
jgi:hypothetical protein